MTDIDLSTGAPPSPERTLQLAEALPGITRTLNHQTMHHEALSYPDEANRLLRELLTAVQRFPQLLDQDVRWLEIEHAAGRIAVTHGEWAGLPATAITALQAWRDAAIAAAEDFGSALAEMARVTSCLAAAETEGDDGGE